MSSSRSVHEGQHVILRPITPSDASLTFRWRQSARASLLNTPPESPEAQARWIDSRPDNELNFIIETRGRVAIGTLSLIGIDQVHSRAESGRFLIGEEESAKGIPAAVEAMKMLYEIAFDELALQRVYGTVASNNTLMIKWQRYLGMKEEGRLRRHYNIDGQFQDAVCLGLLAEEFRTLALPRMKGLIAAASR